MKTNSRYKTGWNKWWLLQPKGKELKKIHDRQKRIELKQLIDWNAGAGGRWHEESREQLLSQHKIPVITKRKRSR